MEQTIVKFVFQKEDGTETRVTYQVDKDHTITIVDGKISVELDREIRLVLLVLSHTHSNKHPAVAAHPPLRRTTVPARTVYIPNGHDPNK